MEIYGVQTLRESGLHGHLHHVLHLHFPETEITRKQSIKIAQCSCSQPLCPRDLLARGIDAKEFPTRNALSLARSLALSRPPSFFASLSSLPCLYPISCTVQSVILLQTHVRILSYNFTLGRAPPSSREAAKCWNLMPMCSR
jgi:hypothetical protein